MPSESALLAELLFTISFVHAVLLTVVPEGQGVSYPGGMLNFVCFTTRSSPTLTTVEWTLNGTEIQEVNMGGVIITENFSVIFGGVLSFNNLSEVYNNTVIRCRASLSNGGTSSGTSTLLLQGIEDFMQEILAGNHFRVCIIVHHAVCNLHYFT